MAFCTFGAVLGGSAPRRASSAMWQCLYFFLLPHQHGSFRPTSGRFSAVVYHWRHQRHARTKKFDINSTSFARASARSCVRAHTRRHIR